MIARVHPKGLPSTSSDAASTDGALQSDMQLRVYTLSSLHSLLCTLAPMFELTSCYSYSDIYTDDWDPYEYELSWPYPAPSLTQIDFAHRRGHNGELSSEHGVPSPVHHPYVMTEDDGRRNWNELYKVPLRVQEEWEDVDAVVLVLRKKQLVN